MAKGTLVEDGRLITVFQNQRVVQIILKIYCLSVIYATSTKEKDGSNYDDNFEPRSVGGNIVKFFVVREKLVTNGFCYACFTTVS